MAIETTLRLAVSLPFRHISVSCALGKRYCNQENSGRFTGGTSKVAVTLHRAKNCLDDDFGRSPLNFLYVRRTVEVRQAVSSENLAPWGFCQGHGSFTRN